LAATVRRDGFDGVGRIFTVADVKLKSKTAPQTITCRCFLTFGPARKVLLATRLREVEPDTGEAYLSSVTTASTIP
jgi:hypothetical protein